MLEQGQKVRSSSPEEQGAAETTYDELTATPIPSPPALLGGRRQRKTGSEVEPRKKGVVREGFLRFSFYFLINPF